MSNGSRKIAIAVPYPSVEDITQLRWLTVALHVVDDDGSALAHADDHRGQ